MYDEYVDEDVEEPLWGFGWAGKAAGVLVAAALVMMSMAGGVIASRAGGEPRMLKSVNSDWFDRLSDQTVTVGQLCGQADLVQIPLVVATDAPVKVGIDRLLAAVENVCTRHGTLSKLQSALTEPQVWTPKTYYTLENKAANAIIEMRSSLSFLQTAMDDAQLTRAMKNFEQAKSAADLLIGQGRAVYDYSSGHVADESTRTALAAQLASCQAASETTTVNVSELTAATTVLTDCTTKLPQLIAGVQTSMQVRASLPASPSPTPTPSSRPTAAPAPPVYYGDTPTITEVTLIADDGNSITVGVTVTDPDEAGYNLCVGNGNVQRYRYVGQRGTANFAVRFAIGDALRSPWAMLC